MTQDTDDDLVFADDGNAPGSAEPPWRVLVVDDERDVHSMTDLLLRGFSHKGRGLELLHAHSGAEACEIMESEQDIAVLLLDVVMETDHAGLDAARHIRDTLQNRNTRIVVRTGQPGMAPANAVVLDYGVNEYREKTELTAERLVTTLHTSLDVYDALTGLEQTNQQLAEAKEAMEQFSSIVAHDLKAPLRNVETFSTILGEAIEEQDEEGIQRCIQIISSGVRNMRQLLNDLLELSRLGREPPEFTTMDFNQALDEALANLQAVIAERGAKIERNDLPDSLRGNYRYIVQLLQNLISNAIKFQPGEAPVVVVSAEHRDQQWVISIADQGIDVPADKMERIFEPFQRLHPQSEYEGSGIGLAMCSKVAAVHGGRIWAESEPKEGTTIHVAFPESG